MRINTVGAPPVTIPEQSLEVGPARAARPVEQRSPGAGEAPARPLPGTLPVPVPPTVPGAREAERRQDDVRRGEDRRKRQVPVLIDTRVGERRAKRRRAADDAPPSVDVKA